MNSVSTKRQYQPSVGVDTAGNLYAIWTDHREGAQTGDPNIYFAKRPAATGTWGTNLRINDDTGKNAQSNPQVAVANDGSSVAVWIDHRTNQQNVYAARLAAGSTQWSANTRVTPTSDLSVAFPDVALGPDGTAHAVWQQGTPRVVYYASLAAGSSTWSAPVAISDAPGADAYRPSIGADAAGNLIVTWLDLRDPPTVDVREARRPAGGQTWTASRLVGDSRELWYRLATPSLMVRGDGHAYLVWEDKASALFVVGAEYDPATDTWSAPDVISDGPADKDAEQPSAFLTDTQVAVAWRDERLDAGGDIFVRTGSLGAGIGEDHTTYTLDRLYRLTSVSGPDGARTYAYDPVGNRTSRLVSGATTTYTYDRADRITAAGSQSVTVNAVGATTARGADSFSYDQPNRLKTATVGGSTETNVYDGDGVRFSRQVGGGPVTRYVTDPAPGLPVTIDDGTRKYVWGLGLAYAVAGSNVEVHHADRLGSIRAITDGAGTVVSSFRTDEFGIPTSSTGAAGSPYRYTGEPMDASGLTYLRARYYDATIGRFITRDPFAGFGAAPLSLNRYSYVHNNPATLSDPSGLSPSSLVLRCDPNDMLALINCGAPPPCFDLFDPLNQLDPSCQPSYVERTQPSSGGCDTSVNLGGESGIPMLTPGGVLLYGGLDGTASVVTIPCSPSFDEDVFASDGAGNPGPNVGQRPAWVNSAGAVLNWVRNIEEAFRLGFRLTKEQVDDVVRAAREYNLTVTPVDHGTHGPINPWRDVQHIKIGDRHVPVPPGYELP